MIRACFNFLSPFFCYCCTVVLCANVWCVCMYVWKSICLLLHLYLCQYLYFICKLKSGRCSCRNHLPTASEFLSSIWVLDRTHTHTHTHHEWRERWNAVFIVANGFYSIIYGWKCCVYSVASCRWFWGPKNLHLCKANPIENWSLGHFLILHKWPIRWKTAASAPNLTMKCRFIFSFLFRVRLVA